MQFKPLTQQVFSSDPRKESWCRLLCLAATVAMTALLYVFWLPLRSPEVAYPLVSPTVTNRFWAMGFRVITTLGSEGFFLVVLSVIYWSINKTVGFWGFVLMPLSILVTSEIPKDITRLPRPDVRGVSVPTYTFPSGHASGATVMWAYAAMVVQKSWFWLVALALIILVGFSRITLGYHFPGDVLGGFVAGIVFLAVSLWVGLRVDRESLAQRLPWSVLLTLAFLVPFLLAFMPVKVAPGLLGYVSGAGVGYLLQRRYVRFRLDGQFVQHVLRGFIGLLPLPVLLVTLTRWIPMEWTAAKFLQYFLATFWVAYLAPLVFARLGLMALGEEAVSAERVEGDERVEPVGPESATCVQKDWRSGRTWTPERE